MDFLIKNSWEGPLRLYVAGEEQCAPYYHFGPWVRRHYLLHYIYSGCGYFTCGGHTYPLHAGQAFLIVPNMVTYYQADGELPWHYTWLEFGGEQAEAFLRRCGLGETQPVYTAKDKEAVSQQFRRLLDFVQENREDGYRVMGGAFLLFDALIRCNAAPPPAPEKPAGEYVHRAVEYIRYHYYRPITVSELCALVGVERSYLCRLFKAQTGKSPQAYILAYKLDAARMLLQDGNLSVAQAARSVGYEDQSAFSKLYKKRFGIAPKQEQGRLS